MNGANVECELPCLGCTTSIGCTSNPPIKEAAGLPSFLRKQLEQWNVSNGGFANFHAEIC
jgi:hypothetical protein